MTPNVERRLGDRIARELYRDPDYVDDAVLMEGVVQKWPFSGNTGVSFSPSKVQDFANIR